MRNAMRDNHKMCRVKIPIRGIGANVLGLPTSNVLLGEALQLRIASLCRAACFTSGRLGGYGTGGRPVDSLRLKDSIPPGSFKNERSRGVDSLNDSSGFLETASERARCIKRGSSIESEEKVKKRSML